MQKSFDFIICGMGCAGLSLAYRLCDPAFNDKKILLIDKGPKDQNDRTWCFWEKEEGPFQFIVKKEWRYLWFHNEKLSKRMDIKPYRYKMIRGIDFYEFTLKSINKQENIEIVYADIEDIIQQEKSAEVKTTQGNFMGNYVFSSLFREKIDKSKYYYVDQHFKGWFIRSGEPVFDIDCATFMDFRIDQHGECRFLYILPSNPHEALVEVAIFSNNLLDDQEYEQILKDYISGYTQIDRFEILEKEYGVIPMTVYPFEQHNTENILHIGTAGGVAKASTGYAFKRIQDHTERIIQHLRNGHPPHVEPSFFQNRFRWYDKVLLDVLLNDRYPLAYAFGDMFEKVKVQRILRFLNNESNFNDELMILKAPPMAPFLKGAIP